MIANASSGPLVGVIADDVTGGTDIAVAFRRRGHRVWVSFGDPNPNSDETEQAAAADVVVVALKIRTVPAATAISAADAAADWLLSLGTSRIYYKYCSTFDSSAAGNIGPVLDALMTKLDAPRVVHTPSSPEHGRTQYLGHLFVHDQLLAESPMRNHPLTPMRDSSLPRLLKAQTPSDVKLITYPTVAEGTDSISRRLDTLGQGHVLVDAVTDADLIQVGAAVADEPLTAGAAGLAGGLAQALRAEASPSSSTPEIDGPGKRTVILAGSCSARTLEQIAAFRETGLPTHRFDLERDHSAAAMADRALTWFDSLDAGQVPLLYSSLPPDELRAVQQRFGVDAAAAEFEDAMRIMARELADRGIDTFVVAGGETSGAVIDALGFDGSTVGAEAATGVPWMLAPNGTRLLFKSGNFGEVTLLADIGRSGSTDSS